MKRFVLFLMTYTTIFLIYQLFVSRKAKKNNKKQPIEVQFLVNRYKLDLEQINYKRLLLAISMVSSFDISIIVTLVLLINSYLLKLVVAFVLTIILILISYSLIGNYYKKKGMIKNV